MSVITYVPRLLWFVLWYAWDLASSNVTVVWDNLTPGQNSTPGIVRLDTWCRTDVEVTTFATLIALAPGTLALGAATRVDGLRVLYVHGMYCDSPEGLREELRVLERRLLGVLRLAGFAETGAPPESPLRSGGDE